MRDADRRQQDTLLKSAKVARRNQNLALLLELSEVRVNDGGEAVFTGDHDSLATGELELGTSQGLTSVVDLVSVSSDRDEHLTDSDTGALAKSFTIGVSHTSLKSISTGAAPPGTPSISASPSYTDLPFFTCTCATARAPVLTM